VTKKKIGGKNAVNKAQMGKIIAELKRLEVVIASVRDRMAESLPTQATALRSAAVFARKATAALKVGRVIDAPRHLVSSVDHLEHAKEGMAEDSERRLAVLRAIDDLCTVRDAVFFLLGRYDDGSLSMQRDQLRKFGEAIRTERKRLQDEMRKLKEATRTLRQRRDALRRVSALIRP